MEGSYEIEVEVEDLELDNLTTIAVAFDRSFSIAVDPNYGADADGRRGMRMEFIEDDRYSQVMVNVSRKINPNRWKPLTAFREANRARIEEAIADWMANHSPEVDR